MIVDNYNALNRLKLSQGLRIVKSDKGVVKGYLAYRSAVRSIQSLFSEIVVSGQFVAFCNTHNVKFGGSFLPGEEEEINIDFLLSLFSNSYVLRKAKESPKCLLAKCLTKYYKK